MKLRNVRVYATPSCARSPGYGWSHNTLIVCPLYLNPRLSFLPGLDGHNILISCPSKPILADMVLQPWQPRSSMPILAPSPSPQPSFRFAGFARRRCTPSPWETAAADRCPTRTGNEAKFRHRHDDVGRECRDAVASGGHHCDPGWRQLVHCAVAREAGRDRRAGEAS